MKINQTDLITVPRSRKPGHCQFIGGSDARIINEPGRGRADPTVDRRSQPRSRRQIANGAGSALAAHSGQVLAS